MLLWNDVDVDVDVKLWYCFHNDKEVYHGLSSFLSMAQR